MAAIDDVKSGIERDAKATYAKNRMDIRSSLEGDAKDNRLVVIGAGNKTDTGFGLGKNVEDNRSAVVNAEKKTDVGLALKGDVRDDGLVVVDDGFAIRDDKSIIRNDGLAVDNDRLVARIGKKTDIDNESNTRVGNQADAGPGNGPDADLIITTTGDIKVDLIKNFNNGVLVVVLAKLSCIILDKLVMDFSARIFTNIINNLFRDLFPFSKIISSFSLLPFLSTPTTGNFDNILTTFIYYMLIYMQDFVPSQWLYLPLPFFPLCLT